MAWFKNKKKNNVIYALADDEKTEVRQLMGRLKELRQGMIGTNAVFQATLQAIASQAGITSAIRVEFDADAMAFIEVPVQPPAPEPPHSSRP